MSVMPAVATPAAQAARTPLTVAQAASWAQTLGLPRLDAQVLLLHALGRALHDRAWLLAHGDDLLDTTAQTTLLPMHNAVSTPNPWPTSRVRKSFLA